MTHTCENCGEDFGTLSSKRLHDCPKDVEPDFEDPFSPNPDSDQEMVCLHCGENFPEPDVVYEERFGETLWWCPNENCDGKGVGIDIHPADGMDVPDEPLQDTKMELPDDLGEIPQMATSIGAPDCPECGSSDTEIKTYMDDSEGINCIDCGTESKID